MVDEEEHANGIGKSRNIAPIILGCAGFFMVVIGLVIPPAPGMDGVIVSFLGGVIAGIGFILAMIRRAGGIWIPILGYIVSAVICTSMFVYIVL